MNLPELPKQNKKKEADFGVQLRHFLDKNRLLKTCSLEIKHTRGKNYLNFNALEEKQIIYANNIKSDKGSLIRVQGLNGEPDYIYLRNEPAFIVIRYPKNFYFIPIDIFLKEKEISERKSLLEDRAREISGSYFLA